MEFDRSFSPDRSSSPDVESGYASADSTEALPEISFTRPHLKFLNRSLSQLSPEDILRWCLMSLPSLYQESAFGLSGLVTLDMLSKIEANGKTRTPLIFLDTLHHFDETLHLLSRIRDQYPRMPVHVFKPAGVETAQDFSDRYGQTLWTSNEELYDYNAKVEPAERAFRELGVKAVLTGRRQAQGGSRKALDIIEVDETGLIKINPLARWSFAQVQDYIHEHNVPYNALLDMGYKSVGDWHSTAPVSGDESERAGRWKGREKTECGIHNPKSRYAQILMEQARREEQEQQTPEPGELVEKLERVSIQAC
ncbi:MAG: hypothetical protein M1828_007003 [Chrysothrix sp. TS-e1954]|nr:MAG: hypothetical protein M1828_007003 [Chrysothrix sp. TS-e1954]